MSIRSTLNPGYESMDRIRKHFGIPIILMVLVFSLILETKASSFELKSRYAAITYQNRADLRRFNEELYLGGRLRLQVRLHRAETVEEEVAAKINVIVEKAMTVLNMFPSPLTFSIVILPDTTAVRKTFRKIYNSDVDYIAFYSPRLNRVFYSANNGRLRVTCHEIGHVVVENYFKVSPPQHIHEIMAHYVEKHIND